MGEPLGISGRVLIISVGDDVRKEEEFLFRRGKQSITTNRCSSLDGTSYPNSNKLLTLRFEIMARFHSYVARAGRVKAITPKVPKQPKKKKVTG